MKREEFIHQAWKQAQKAQKQGAPISVPIAVAQAALETGFGKSKLSSNHNNLFGIKGEFQGQYALMPTVEQKPDGSWFDVNAKFRKYDSWSDCFYDYGQIIKNLDWYQDAEEAAHNPKKFLEGIIVKRDKNGNILEPGWATDHDYFNKVWGIVQEYDLEAKQEVNGGDEIELLQLFDGDCRIDIKPLKHTLGRTSDGKPKLMVRVKPTTFWQRLRYLFS